MRGWGPPRFSRGRGFFPRGPSLGAEAKLCALHSGERATTIHTYARVRHACGVRACVVHVYACCARSTCVHGTRVRLLRARALRNVYVLSRALGVRRVTLVRFRASLGKMVFGGALLAIAIARCACAKLCAAEFAYARAYARACAQDLHAYDSIHACKRDLRNQACARTCAFVRLRGRPAGLTVQHRAPGQASLPAGRQSVRAAFARA